ncbi:preprotein translocase subunit SecE [Anaeromassilibacillus sp. An200]|uniref:Protein translocase subunit SecE n=2 Tax=Candidatus Caccousia TaxID=2840638 RepID=A0A9D1DET8_9FIRM|nr:preprotein translocase subunit SecE [Anaeromassilibacillus sp. An200]OUP14009.1 preprotein translocase subunit SecE [Anaeromassilibacillus sp. An200]HIR46199.1 preprotein translocase subunit SecE [Candidatus Caccousia avicola]HIS79362.1 preprotein translocase subunit SecE [Candidatus Caccousia stercoris]
MADTEKKIAPEKKASPEKKDKKPGKFSASVKNAGKFFRDVKSEIKKIVWPTPKSVFKNTGVVLVAIIISGIFISGLDSIFLALLGLVMNV